MRTAAEFSSLSRAEIHCPDKQSFKLPLQEGRAQDDDTKPQENSTPGYLPDFKVKRGGINPPLWDTC